MYISRNFQWLMVDSAVVLCNLQTFQFYYNPALLFYPLLVPEIADTTILYSHKVIKTFNCYFNHKCKFTEVTWNTSHVYFDRPYWNRTLSSTLCSIDHTCIANVCMLWTIHMWVCIYVCSCMHALFMIMQVYM